MERHLGPILQIHLVILKLQDRALPLPLRRAWEEAFAMLVIKTYCPATLGISVSSCAYTCSMANWPVELVLVITICRMHRMPPDLMKTALLQSSADYLFLTEEEDLRRLPSAALPQPHSFSLLETFSARLSPVQRGSSLRRFASSALHLSEPADLFPAFPALRKSSGHPAVPRLAHVDI